MYGEAAGKSKPHLRPISGRVVSTLPGSQLARPGVQISLGGVVPLPDTNRAHMTIYPAIDIRGGRCVRLTQGRADQETIYAEVPAAVAAQFQAAGSAWVHVVDLDGAFAGESRNLPAVRAVVALGLKVQLGGGLRTRDAVERALGLGVSRVVIGTRAAESEAFVAGLVQAFGERIAVGIDARNGQVAVKGWVDTAGTGAVALAGRMDALGVATLIHTDISTDGMLTGPNLAAQETMLAAVTCRVIASGGVSRREDVMALAEMKKRRPNLDGVIIGKALYEKRVELGDLLALVS
jgi:phosphoribosylformimino-5-aminoimidazole carboxamide ribotide isomerase